MKNRKGFTLIELVVVVMILGILASMGVPYYYKSIETTRAGDAVALGHLLGNANRMYALDNANTYASGAVTNTCNGSTCATASGACKLVACGYVTQQDWSNSSYDFYACNGAAGGAYCANSGSELGVSYAFRKAGASTPYSTWGYRFYNSGRCEALGTTPPPCPKF
jgi:prepilin-type N-terminal cleavage/methylation domain-containing protein